jgi:hypothetical protein
VTSTSAAFGVLQSSTYNECGYVSGIFLRPWRLFPHKACGGDDQSGRKWRGQKPTLACDGSRGRDLDPGQVNSLRFETPADRGGSE